MADPQRHPIAEIIDRRNDKKEGDFVIIDTNGNRLLVEVKADCNSGYLRSGNLLVEIDNGTGKGWYQWAIHEGVTHLCYVFYRQGKQQPYAALWIDFRELQALIDAHTYAKTRNGQCLRVPVQDIAHGCLHTVVLARREPDNTSLQQLTDFFTREGVRI